MSLAEYEANISDGQELQIQLCIDDAVGLRSFSPNMLPEIHDICIGNIKACRLDIHGAIFLWQRSMYSSRRNSDGCLR
ncbi:uncharacterized protein YALI1_C23120g [Yarrowia lipolytica]|jgi:hypothetical protein|uniref:Uncharacterized protein n=1 Tax=Yarrowia lipolytica TaxID=4952 RepID=A0A1D8NBE9_YARLL|nr:hypothetical protein YALI1_C23120g [Yarrowia lipolytica]